MENTTDQNQHLYQHKSVLVKEVLTYLNPQPGEVYVDATFGGGGHTKAILAHQPNCSIVGIDWDIEAVERNEPFITQQFGNHVKVLWGNFAQLYKLLKKERITKVAGILADFGTSQFQIHNKPGFSFQQDTPLDMRMSPAHQRTTAATIVNTATEKELMRILFDFGDEFNARKIVRAIMATRTQTPFTTTGQLTELIEAVIPLQPFKQKYGIHPATKTFQALRIAVNNELENIETLLKASLSFLKPGGRIVCISFHSLEDRLVKNFFRDNQAQLNIVTPKPIMATDEELAQNPSARSAKLRAAELR